MRPWREPPAAKALVAVSAGADMLVVGSRGRSRLKELTVGSVSIACFHEVRCPFVVIHPDGKDSEAPGGRPSDDLNLNKPSRSSGGLS